MQSKYQQQWDEVINNLKEKFDSKTYEEIIEPINTVHKFEDNILYIIAPSLFHKSRIEKFFYEDFIEEILNVCKKTYDVKFIVEDEIKKNLHEQLLTQSDNLPKLFRGNLKPTYTFSNYVVGKFNRFASTTALKVAEQPGMVANPLYIFGGVGLGKTHLMQAIGNYVLDDSKDAKVLYIKTEKFIEEFVTSIRTSNKSLFSKKFDDIDVFLIDDIQFLSKAEESQIEFFKIFEELHNKNKQIVVTSDRKPSELKNMMDRLTSRFEWGVLVDITAPDLQNRIDIIKKKILSENINEEFITKEAINYIAKVFVNSVRELEGALKRVIFYCAMGNIDCSLEVAKEALETIVPEKNIKSINMNDITERVCAYYNLSREQLMSTIRKKEIAYPRHIAMYLMREMLDAPFKKIAYYFGGRDHSSVIYAVDKIKLNIQVDKDLQKAIAELKEINFDS